MVTYLDAKPGKYECLIIIIINLYTVHTPTSFLCKLLLIIANVFKYGATDPLTIYIRDFLDKLMADKCI